MCSGESMEKGTQRLPHPPAFKAIIKMSNINFTLDGSETSSENPIQRLRVIVSCDYWCVSRMCQDECHSLARASRGRKIKCSTQSGQTQCDACLKRQRECTYDARSQYYKDQERLVATRITRGGGAVATTGAPLGGSAGPSMITFLCGRLHQTPVQITDHGSGQDFSARPRLLPAVSSRNLLSHALRHPKNLSRQTTTFLRSSGCRISLRFSSASEDRLSHFSAMKQWSLTF
jgi:hypothetical protein